MTIALERLGHKERADGTAQIYLRITHQRKQRYLATGIYARQDKWDANRGRLRGYSKEVVDTNARLADVEQLAADAVAGLHRSGEVLTAQRVKELVAVQLLAPLDEAPVPDFLSYVRSFTDAYKKRGMHRSWKRINAIVNKLDSFLREHIGRTVPFEAVTTRVMREWVDHLMAPKSEGGHGNKENTAATNVNAIRTICRAAIREDVAPFGWRDPTQGLRLRQRPAPKERLTREEIDALGRLGTEKGLGDGTAYEPGQWRTDGALLALIRDMFLFSLYVAGIRFGDIAQLRFADFRERNGIVRVHYRMDKSSDDMGLLLPAPAQNIYRRYHDARIGLPAALTGGRVFGLLDGKTEPNGSWRSAHRRSDVLGAANAVANTNLEKLAKLAEIKRGTHHLKLTTHMARHTWADLARQSDWAITDIQQALGHSSPAITQRYLNGFDQGRLDEKMRSLF